VSDQREAFLIRYTHEFAPFIVARASGAWIETMEGQHILDFTPGQISSTIGHTHPRIVAAVQQALDTVIHLNSWMLSEPVLALAEKRVELAVPTALEQVILINTEGEANEVALRLAEMHTGRFEIVGLTRSWHGLQAGVASLNLAGGHAGYGPMMPGAPSLPAVQPARRRRPGGGSRGGRRVCSHGCRRGRVRCRAAWQVEAPLAAPGHPPHAKGQAHPVDGIESVTESSDGVLSCP
jgi:4-aminobutyrate aminotransferase-like enzyme